ncbi:hypothetical protein AGABI2DRAFT_182670 [Agaricus bisporus var. bisporus H97]|uniref:hypothetical protein n=1 Tax=Agaricus bisporus var. bisporus (strain H97 / ATCC MYA-4626 / FGSC 10389) TaxID=936046 RepID=UPI00029F708E|nr:hypothetical protein AGABI2DRAFT_182670 [Agaricus bisporus var. bisporus H97]EKV51717.1 hypothetical protein AGABI2DRAFT_182670 [Agaricus bisporus var. bisporus H97]
MPSPNFELAAAYLSTASSLTKVSNTVKLELYGLFKYVTTGPKPTVSRPSIFDMTGRAKWDAWNAAGQKYVDAQEAELRYLQMAKELGWDETKIDQSVKNDSKKGKGKVRAGEEGDDDIWDSDSDSGDSTTKSNSGLGLTVSTMAGAKEASEKTLHGFAVDNDVRGIEDLLKIVPNLNLNEMDEYGYTPLHLAADRGHIDVVKLLLSKGVDKSIKDPDDMTALELAHCVGNEDIISALSG